MASKTEGPVGSKRALQEPPVEQIKDLSKSYPEVWITISRRNHKGHMASLPGGGIRKDTLELIHAATWLEEMAGGGHYYVRTYDPEELSKELLPTFCVHIEGPERSARQNPQQRRTGGGGMSSPRGSTFGATPQLTTPPWMPRGDHEGGVPEEFARYSTEIASAATAEIRQELRETREALEAERRRFETQREQWQAELQKEREAAAEALRRADQQRLESELQNLREQLRNPDRSSQPQMDVAAIIAAVAPIVQALIGNSKTSQELALRNQETQFGALKDVLVATSSKKDDSTKMFSDVIMPLILKQMDERSPSKMADLIATMSSGQLETLGMLSEFFQNAVADQPDNPWFGVVERGINSLKEMAEQMADVAVDRRDPQTTQQPQQLPPNASPEQIADAIMKAPALPEDLRTSEWRELFRAIHDRRVSVETVAKNLAIHLDGLAEKSQLPQMFQGMLESPQAPSYYLGPILEQLPIAQLDRTRAENILRAFDQAFIVDEEDSHPAEVVDNGRSTQQKTNGPFDPPIFVVTDSEEQAAPQEN